jgi:hypothetical protein
VYPQPVLSKLLSARTSGYLHRATISRRPRAEYCAETHNLLMAATTAFVKGDEVVSTCEPDLDPFATTFLGCTFSKGGISGMGKSCSSAICFTFAEEFPRRRSRRYFLMAELEARRSEGLGMAEARIGNLGTPWRQIQYNAIKYGSWRE